MKRSLLLATLLFSFGVQAQPSFTFSGQIRHRSELDNRDFSGMDDALLSHLLRSRFGVRVEVAPGIRGILQLQDARLFGGEDPSLGRGTLDADADQLDLRQALIDVSDLLGTGLGASIGRQELVYGNERMIGRNDWGNTGRSFDAGVLRFRREGVVSADLFAAQLVSPVQTNGSQNVFGLYSSWSLAEGHALDVFAFYDEDNASLVGGPDSGEDRLQRMSPGVYARGRSGRFDYSAEAIGQFGRLAPADSVARLSIGGSFFSAGAGYVVAPGANVRAGASYSRISGDDDPTDTKSGVFNAIFISVHPFFGTMDYFPRISTPNGLQDLMLSVSGNLAPTFKVSLDAHHFMTTEDVAGAKTLGQEIDLSGTYTAAPGFMIGAGASVFLPGDVIEAGLGSETTTWAYLSSSLTF